MEQYQAARHPHHDAAKFAVGLRLLFDVHSALLEDNPYCYCEVSFTRQTGWMAWLCSKPQADDPGRKILGHGQGSTPDEAAIATVDSYLDGWFAPADKSAEATDTSAEAADAPGKSAEARIMARLGALGKVLSDKNTRIQELEHRVAELHDAISRILQPTQVGRSGLQNCGVDT